MKPTLTLAQTSLWNTSTLGPSIIAGPCGAETREQILETGLALAQQGIMLVRIGIWKARTRPNGFMGAGEEALPWVQELKKLTGQRVVAEVGNVQQIQQALEAGIDGLWIGARTTVNPFAMQELAEALRGTNIPVMVKNPVNPDLNLWIGGIERLNQVGLTDLAACHRGFSVGGRHAYRNTPAWEIPLELRRQLPALPLYCDPSHIAGRADLVFEVAQKALDLGFDGLMIETHRNPAEALSDADQQITPAQLKELRSRLVVRHADSQDERYRRELETQRTRIDELDQALLGLIARRMEVVRQIGLLKQENEVQYFQLDRFRELYASRLEAARALGLGDDFTERLLQLLHLEALDKQGS
jgi:chorismate mutase